MENQHKLRFSEENVEQFKSNIEFEQSNEEGLRFNATGRAIGLAWQFDANKAQIFSRI